MPSRKKRKRDRRRAEATALSVPSSSGGWGKEYPLKPGDIRLAARAVRNGWPTPFASQRAVSEAVVAAMDADEAPTRIVLAGARFALAVFQSRNDQLFAEIDRQQAADAASSKAS